MEETNAKNHSSYMTFTLLGLIMPVIGIIVGIVYLTKDASLDRKMGEHLIAMSVLGFILQGALYSLLSYPVIL